MLLLVCLVILKGINIDTGERIELIQCMLYMCLHISGVWLLTLSMVLKLDIGVIGGQISLSLLVFGGFNLKIQP